MALDSIGLQQPMRYKIDIKSGLVQIPMRTQLMKGDRQANRVIVEVLDNKKPVDLSGIAVTGSFIRPPDDAEIPLTGKAIGGEVSVTLDDACYEQDGYCEIHIAMTQGETKRTILSLTGYVLGKGSGAIIDVGGVIPNIQDIIAQYEMMKVVTEETAAARDAALEAAKSANFTVIGQYSTLAQLKLAHPTGNAGDAYAVGTAEPYVVYIWDVDEGEWKSIGQIQGAAGPQGPEGAAGRGIQSISRTSGNGSPGTRDTYTVRYTDGTTWTYQVYNGADGRDAEGATYDQQLNTTSSVRFASVTADVVRGAVFME